MASERLQPWWYFRKGNLPSDRAVEVFLELIPRDVETVETREAVDALRRGPWRAVYSIAFDEGRPAIDGVLLEPIDPAGEPIDPAGGIPPLAAELARELLKPAGALNVARKAFREIIEEGDPDAEERDARERYFAAFHGLDAAQLGAERRGKRQPDYFYAAIAALYVNAHTAGSRRPVADVADQLPKPYKPPFIRDALSKARARGLLERSAGQRQAGGELTASGLRVLQKGPPDGYVGPEPPPARGS